MAIESKEIIMYLRKGVMFSIRVSHRSACAHPYILGMLFFLLILYRAFPSLFAFLISSSPVIVCTAILLGTLLSYGTPNIPEVEEEDKKTQEISSLQIGSAADYVIVNKDENYKVETHLETDMKVNERVLENAVDKTSDSASNDIERDSHSAKIYGKGNPEENTVLSTSWLLQEDNKEMQREMKIVEETEVVDSGSVEKREFSIENQAVLAQELDADVHTTAVNDQNEPEGLTIQIAKTASECPFDSSLGSPWEPVDTYDASSGSDSDGAESSSPDASMADIIPMLDELHPLLDSEHPQAPLRATDDSDAVSSEFSQNHESDYGITEEEVENKEDADIESRQKGDTNEAAVPWTEDHQKNVMDLGYSEVERNRRLENLIANRRLRKLQRLETEKHLIDLDSYYPSPIPSISAPRRNPFDLPYDYDGNLNPIPGSAPSVLQPRQNLFDLPSYDKVEELTTSSREYLSHHDFVSAAQREMLSEKHESSTGGPSFSGGFIQERKGSKLNPYFVAERTDSAETGFTAFGRQLSPKSYLKISSVSESDISPVTGQVDRKEELTETEMNQDSTMFSPISHDVHVEQDRQSFEVSDSSDNRHGQIRMDVDTDRAIDFNTTNIEEIHQAANAFGVMEEDIGEVADNLCVSDTKKLEVVEERCKDSNTSSSVEENEQISGVNIHEESDILEQKRDDTIQSDQVDGGQCDSIPSAVRKTLSNSSAPDEAFLYEDFSEVASPPRPFKANLSLESQDLVAARNGEDLASGIGELLVESSDLSVVDKNESKLREITEIKEHDTVEVGISETSGDVHPLVPEMPEPASGQIMHSLSLSSEDHSVDVDKSIQSEGNDMINELKWVHESVIPPPEAGVQESQVSILELPSISEKNLENLNLEDHRIVICPPTTSFLTAKQVVEESNICMFDIEQEPARCQQASEEIGNDDLAIGLVSEGKSSDASEGSPMVPTHDGGFPGSHVHGVTESTEFKTQLEMKSEHEMGSNDDLSDSQSKITDEILSKQEVGFSKILNNSDKELDDEVHAEISGIKDIDESLLSELDAVGDFLVENEMKLDQGGSNLELGQSSSVLKGSCAEMQCRPYRLQDSRDIKDADMPLVISEAIYSCSDKVNPVIDQPKSVKPEVGSFLPSGEDPEMTVYNSKLHVLEACSTEELDSVFKQHHEEDVVSPVSDITVENIVTPKSEKGAKELGIANRNQELISEAEMLDVLPERTHLKPEKTISELHVVEAKSLEDINLALKQLSEMNVHIFPGQMENKDGHTEAEASERQLKIKVIDEPEHIEIQSPEEIKLSPVETTASQMNMVVQQSSERSDGIAVADDVSRSSSSISRKIHKKKSSKSGSSSSSSSSSSDSD